jgi:hypothetical protein
MEPGRSLHIKGSDLSKSIPFVCGQRIARRFVESNHDFARERAISSRTVPDGRSSTLFVNNFRCFGFVTLVFSFVAGPEVSLLTLGHRDSLPMSRLGTTFTYNNCIERNTLEGE